MLTPNVTPVAHAGASPHAPSTYVVRGSIQCGFERVYGPLARDAAVAYLRHARDSGLDLDELDLIDTFTGRLLSWVLA